jgi:hypothetical protein
MRLRHLTMWMRIPRLFSGFLVHVICDCGNTKSVVLSLERNLVKGHRSRLVLSECLAKLGLIIENEDFLRLGHGLCVDLSVHIDGVWESCFLITKSFILT